MMKLKMYRYNLNYYLNVLISFEKKFFLLTKTEYQEEHIFYNFLCLEHFKLDLEYNTSSRLTGDSSIIDTERMLKE